MEIADRSFVAPAIKSRASRSMNGSPQLPKPMKITAWFACVAVASALVGPAAAAPKIGLLMKDRGLFWSAAEQGAAEAAKAAGAEFVAKGPLNSSNLGQQLALLDLLADEGLAALLVAPLTVAEFSGPLARLKAKGVKIVVLDTPVTPGLGETFVGYNQESLARAAGKHFASLVRDGDPVAMMRANSVERISLRERVFVATVKELLPNSALYLDVMAGAEKDDDVAKSLQLLERHPDLKAVATVFTAPSMGMIKAVQEKGVGGSVQHLGFGTGLPAEVVAALEAGRLHAWVAQQPKSLGRRGVEAALDLLAGKTVPESIELEITIVTKESLAAVQAAP